MNKKKILIISATTAILLVPSLISISFISNHANLNVHATTSDYVLNLNSDNSFSKFSKPNVGVKHANVQTKNQNTISFDYVGLMASKDSFNIIDTNGYITNTKAISGIQSIEIMADGNLTLEYGWDIAKDEEKIFSHKKLDVIAGEVLDLASIAPTYIKLGNESLDQIDIQSIAIKYSCEPSYAPFEEIVDFNYFKNNLKNGEATKVVTNMNYAIEELGLNLKFDSTYRIGDKVSELVYSYDKLNGLDKPELTSKITGAYYTDNGKTYSYIDNVLKEVSSVDPNVTLKAINLDETLLSTNTLDKKALTLTVKVKNGSEKAYLNTTKEVSDVSSIFTLGKDRNIKEVVTNYSSTLTVGDKTYITKVTNKVSYTYQKEVVILPN